MSLTLNGQSQNGCFKKVKHVKFSGKRTFFSLYQGLKNVRFSDNLTCIVFLKDPFWDWASALLPTTYGNIRGKNSTQTWSNTRFFISNAGRNWQKIKRRLSNNLRLNYCYLKIIHFLHTSLSKINWRYYKKCTKTSTSVLMRSYN